MRIVVVSGFYSVGMGYTENCLPKALASLGHDVHVLTSTMNVYGDTKTYRETYEAFLGPANQGTGSFATDGYTVHRLRSVFVGGYVFISDLAGCLRKLRPDIVHCTEIASLQNFQLSVLKPLLGFKLFAETHQHLSVVRSYVKEPGGNLILRANYWLTRTLPTWLSSAAVERCYAIAPDCVLVANRFYGVPLKKLKLQSLGTDTQLFRPPSSSVDCDNRARLRGELGFDDSLIVCVYSGRFTSAKNPLILAKAVERLGDRNLPFRSLFIGEGPQRSEIEGCRHSTVVPFLRHGNLADHYRAADIAVWPREESLSMLDAAATALPLVVSDRIGESERVAGNGSTYHENDIEDLCSVLLELADAGRRAEFGERGRAKMITDYSWITIARATTADYELALSQ